MPGDRQEMNQFEETATNNTRLHIEISLPNVNVLLPSKDLFEVIYNRCRPITSHQLISV